MVIQRIQSLYLLIAAIVMGVLCVFVPVALLPDGQLLTVFSFPQLIIVDALCILLLLISIFLFNNLKFQMKVTRINVVLIILSALLQAYICYTLPESTPYIVTPAILYVVALILTAMALSGMKHDYKLLHDSDRLR